MRTAAIFLTLLVAFAFARVAEAADRYKVKASFDLAAAHPYRKDGYPGGRDLTKIRTDLTSLLISKLQDKIRFVDFTTDDALYEIRVELDDRNPDEPVGLREVVFRVRFFTSGQEVEQDQIVWGFRPSGQFARSIVPIETFLSELTQKLGSAIANQYNDIVAKQLVHLKIADTALCIREENVFVLPLTAADLEIGDESTFRVEADVSKTAVGTFSRKYNAVAAGQSAATLNPPYDSKLMIQALSPDNFVAEMKTCEKVMAKAVFITGYFRRETLKPIPATLPLSLGQ